jgi:uncharacterized protein YwgA
MKIPLDQHKAPKAWVAAAVQALRERDSWTGRIHIHKLLFIANVLGLAKPPFKFELYQYGPYSFGLDAVIADMDLDGDISREYPKPGYGPRYELSEDGAALRTLLRDTDANAIKRVADQIQSLKGNDLELIATCLWAERKERVEGDEQIVARVREIKPKYSELEVRRSLASARAMTKSLS